MSEWVGGWVSEWVSECVAERRVSEGGCMCGWVGE